MAETPITILGIPGSLRELSFNRALIRAAGEVAPDGVEVRMFLLHDVPLYNADVEARGNPEPVRALKQAIREAEGVLFSTPQYNRSVSGVLKNAIDWASRPPFESVLAGKPVAIIGATSGQSATEVARQHLVTILESTRAALLDTRTIGLANSGDYIEDGVVRSDEVRRQVRELVEEFAIFIRSQSLVEAAH
jgi:chromate reductase